MKSHLFTFSQACTQAQAHDVLNNTEGVQTWIAPFPYSAILVSKLNAQDLSAILRDRLPNVWFMVAEMDPQAVNGWLPGDLGVRKRSAEGVVGAVDPDYRRSKVPPSSSCRRCGQNGGDVEVFLKRPMRLVVLSYSHHGRGIGQTARALGHDIIGVMDGEEAPRQQLAEIFQCRGFATAGECLDAAQPDAALVAGKHIEMPDHVQACVDRRIPYLLDKPFADCAARLRPVAAASAKCGVFSALTLPNRASRVVATVERLLADGKLGDLVQYSSRLNNGPPSRYDSTPSAWHNDPALSGGGSWAVEAAHGIDTFLQFVGEQPVHVVGALMSNAAHGRTVEDIGLGMLRTDRGVTGLIESGYAYPAGERSGDHFFRFIGTRAMVFQQYGKEGEPLIEIHTAEGVQFCEELSHGERMRAIVEQALTALADGRSFTPNIDQAVRILEIQDAVYDRARRNLLTNGPHPMGTPPIRPQHKKRRSAVCFS